MSRRRDLTNLVRKHVKSVTQHVSSLTVLQKVWFCSIFVFILAFTLLFAIFHGLIFDAVESWKGELLASSWKWIFLVLITTGTSIPPLIGYATSVTLAGYIFGFWRGWAISILGTLIGCSTAFLIYRYGLSGYAARLSTQNSHFMALTAALDGRSGLTLLTMMRFCPIPFALSNAAFSTIPSITFPRFMLASAIGTLRLCVHAFVGSRFANLAEGLDRKSKLVNWIGIVVGLAFGLGSGILVYQRTKRIAQRLADERGEEDNLTGSRLLNEEENDFSSIHSRESDSLLR